MQEARREWLAPQDVERLTVSQQKIGEGVYGEVFIGRLKLRGKKPVSVAVKKFRSVVNDGVHEPAPFSIDAHLTRYNRVISNLKKAGVRMPKMAFVQHEGQPVLVSELFKRGSSTKIMDARSFRETGSQAARETLETIARIMEAGYTPHFDSVGFVQTPYRMHPIVFDIDLLAHHPNKATEGVVNDWLFAIFPRDKERRQAALDMLIRRVKDYPLRRDLFALKENYNRWWGWKRRLLSFFR